MREAGWQENDPGSDTGVSCLRGRFAQRVGTATILRSHWRSSRPSDTRGRIVWEKGVEQRGSRKQIRIPRRIRAAAEETLRENSATRAILLYGSRARGHHRRGSDYDIAVVSSLPREEAFEAAKPLYDEELVKNHWTEIACTSPEDLDRHADTAGTLESRVAREAILIAGERRGGARGGQAGGGDVL